MRRNIYFLLLIVLLAPGCSKDKKSTGTTTPTTVAPVTNPEFIDKLLFVNKNNYQIQTSAAATFSCSDPNMNMDNTGMVYKLTSGEVVPVVITWKDGKTAPTTIYVLGATDLDQIQPAAYFHGEQATDPYDNYVQGWKLLETLPVSNATYGMVLRHADASFGRDWPAIHTSAAPANWWMSTDSLQARQLNLQGIQRATDIGQIFKDLKYPIKRVVASEFYRARQTAAIINAGPTIAVDSRINHTSHNLYPPGLLNGVLAILHEQPIDNNMTLIVTHHPANEPPQPTGVPTFPTVSAFNWSGSYFIKINADSTVTYAGAASYGMMKYWRDLKLKKL